MPDARPRGRSACAETPNRIAFTGFTVGPRDGGFHHTLQVRAPTVMHEVTIQQLQRWLDGAPISPHEAIRKAKLKSMLR